MKKSKLSLKWLEVFLLTARSGAVQEAAQESGLSVSTVSHHIRSLEDTLGVNLFDHARRPLRLTAAGSVFHAQVDEAMRLLRKAETEAQAGDLAETRELSIGLIEDFDSEIGPELARSLAAGMPKCRFRHLTRPSHEILALLRHQDIDVGIATRPQFGTDDLTEVPLLRDPFVLAVPLGDTTAPEDHLAGRSPLPLLRYSGNQIMAAQIEQHLRRLRITLPARFEFDSNQSLMSMVADGDGWAITTPMNYIRAHRFHRQITLLPFPAKSFARTLSVITTDDSPGAAVASVIGTMRRLAEDRAVAPTVERMPWLDGLFRVLPDTAGPED